MERLGVILALAGVSIGCAYAPPADPPPDFRLEYAYDRGPVSPEYQFEYRIVIEADGSAEIRSEGSERWEETFSLSDDQLAGLWQLIMEREVMTRGWREASSRDIPDGGDARWLTVRSDGRQIDAPAHPASRDDQLAVQAIERRLHDLLPHDTLARLPDVIRARFPRVKSKIGG